MSAVQLNDDGRSQLTVGERMGQGNMEIASIDSFFKMFIISSILFMVALHGMQVLVPQCQ